MLLKKGIKVAEAKDCVENSERNNELVRNFSLCPHSCCNTLFIICDWALSAASGYIAKIE